MNVSMTICINNSLIKLLQTNYNANENKRSLSQGIIFFTTLVSPPVELTLLILDTVKYDDSNSIIAILNLWTGGH